MGRDFFRVTKTGGVQVVELALPGTLDAAELDHLNDSLLSQVIAAPHGRWVLDLASVDYVGSAVLGMFVNVRQQVKAGGGMLVLCSMSQTLQEIFRACCMERLFTITRSRDEALRKLA
jgi:anti-anti-sigma factor